MAELPVPEQLDAGVVAGVDDVAEELVGVLLVAEAEMPGEDLEGGVDLRRYIVRRVGAQGPRDPPLQNAEGAVPAGRPS